MKAEPRTPRGCGCVGCGAALARFAALAGLMTAGQPAQGASDSRAAPSTPSGQAAESPADQEMSPEALDRVDLVQRLGAKLPLDLQLVDSSGRPVELGGYFDGRRPVVLALVYYECPSLCTLVLNGLLQAMRDLPLDLGKDFQVITVSFDPDEPTALAAQKKAAYLAQYSRPGAAAGWHFFTAERRAIDRLAEAVGFRFVYDDATDQFLHPSGIVVLTPRGQVSHYLYGVHYAPRDLRLALVEAAGGGVGSAVDKVLLYCFHYDPVRGTYGPAVLNLLRLGAGLTLAALVALIVTLWRQARRRRGEERHGV